MMEFIMDHYLIVMIVVAFIVFAIIGYLVDSAKSKKAKEGSVEVINETAAEAPDITEAEEEIAEEEAQEVGLEEALTEEEGEVPEVEEAEALIPEAEDNN